MPYTKISLKEGMLIKEINPWTMEVLQCLLNVGMAWNYNPTITEGCGAVHMKTSYHYKNLAFDIRTNDLPEAKRVAYHDAIKEELGEEFDIILEGDHIHIEPSPKSYYA